MKKVRVLKHLVLGLLFVFGGGGVAVYAASNSTFNQVVNAPSGAVTADIKDSTTRNSVASPAVAMSAENFSFDCQTSDGTLGTSSEALYVTNEGHADGWTLSIAATGGATGRWSNGGSQFIDFNDSNGSGCTDGAGDADTTAGQMNIDPSGATVSLDCNSSCATTGVTVGSADGFEQGTTDNITLINAAAGSDDLWRGWLAGVDIQQAVPGGQTADTYTLDLTLTATAQ